MPERGDLQNHFFLEIPGFSGGPERDLMGDLVDVTVESSLHLPDVATVVLHDARLRWVDDRRLDPGTPLKVSARGSATGAGTGDAGEHPIFDGEIVELEPEFDPAAQRLTVRAFDRMHRLTRGTRVRSFLNVSDGDLVQKLAREAKLEARAGQASQVHPYVFQNNESNLAFLRGRAAQLGFLLYAEGKTLHFEPPKAEGPAVELRWGETLLDFRPRLTTADQITGSTVRGWDPAARQAIVGQAARGAGRPEIGEARGGEQLARDAFQMEAPVLTVDRPIRTQAAADRLAQAVADRHACRSVEAEGTCAGNSRIVAGTSVRLANVGDRFSGTYFVTSARHVYTADAGYTTHFSVTGQNPSSLLALLAPEPAGVPTNGVAVGIVTDNDDPDGLGRVRVKYPWLTPDHASDWARVVALGAGPGRGLQFLPEVNDEVLVAFELGDIHCPYVLGGLWNGRDKPPADKGAVGGGKVQRRVIKSRAGHTLTLDDSDGSPGITIEDKNGNVIRLDSASDKLTMQVKGDAAVEARGNLTLKAQGRVEISGAGGVKVDGGAATVDVKGSLVNLN